MELKLTLNEEPESLTRSVRFAQKTFKRELYPSVDITRALQLADALEDECIAQKLNVALPENR